MLEHPAQQEADMYRRAEEGLAALSQEGHKILFEQVQRELRTKHPRVHWPNPQGLEDRIHLGMIRELQTDLLAGYQATS
jgi:hypothetical protein